MNTWEPLYPSIKGGGGRTKPSVRLSWRSDDLQPKEYINAAIRRIVRVHLGDGSLYAEHDIDRAARAIRLRFVPDKTPQSYTINGAGQITNAPLFHAFGIERDTVLYVPMRQADETGLVWVGYLDDAKADEEAA